MIPALTFSVLENFVGLACEHATRSTMVLIMRKTVWQTWQVPFVPSIVIGNQIPGPPASLCVTDTNAYSGERGGRESLFLVLLHRKHQRMCTNGQKSSYDPKVAQSTQTEETEQHPNRQPHNTTHHHKTTTTTQRTTTTNNNNNKQPE